MRAVAIVLYTGSMGGAELLNLALAEQMVKLGQRVVLVVVGNVDTMRERLPDSIPCAELGLKRGSLVMLHAWRLARVIRDYGCDSAICVGGGILALALRLGGYRGVVIAQDHGSLLNLRTLGRAASTLKRMERVFDVLTLDAQVPVSHFMRRAVEGWPHSRRLVVIPNGVDTNRFSPWTTPGTHPRLVVGTAARLVRGKGIEVVIDAVQTLRRSGVSVECRVAGEGPLWEHLQQHSAGLGLSDCVRLVGRVTDMPRFWNDVDVCVVPSSGLVESFGMSAAEAMACGRPVVASDAGGLTELVMNSGAGVLVEPGDVDALANALISLSADRGQLARLGNAGRKYAVSQLGIDDCARRYVDLIDAVSRRRSREPSRGV